DVHGSAVAPADLGGGWQVPLPAEYSIPLRIDLAGKHGLPARLPYRSKYPLGMLTIRDGRLFFNNQPLPDPEQEAALQACRSRTP
ncbi:MAG: hypothetical protein K2Q10_04690, partial [Rhodospirillales bacterium]|nr:hypothetical protein [Rhodospirillales bacterium]